MDQMTQIYMARLRRVAAVYAEARGLALSTVGRMVAGKCDFFPLLAEGRVTLRRANRVLERLSDNWPEGLEWPPDIPRPEPPAAVGAGPKGAA